MQPLPSSVLHESNNKSRQYETLQTYKRSQSSHGFVSVNKVAQSSPLKKIANDFLCGKMNHILRGSWKGQQLDPWLAVRVEVNDKMYNNIKGIMIII